LKAPTDFIDDGSPRPQAPPALVSAGEQRLHRSKLGFGETLREYWFYRELFYFFVWRDVKVRYKQTILGAAWAVLQPFLAMIVFTLLFGRVAKLPNDGIPYPIFYYCGLLPWTYFSGAFNRAGMSLISNTALITKIYFPRALVPASSVFTGLFDFAFASLLLVGMMWWYSMSLTWSMLLWPVLILPLTLLAIGVGLLLSALNVAYRDVKHIIPFLAQIGMFVSPVVYPLAMIPERYRVLMLLNPVTGVIEAFRASISTTRPIDWGAFGISTAVTLVIFVIGFVYFRKTERNFADII